MSQLYVLLDHIRSAYNVGSIFRTCDSAGVDRLLLTGWCAIPPNPKLQKTALGSIDHVEWEHHCEPSTAVDHLKSLGFKIVCFETTKEAVSLFDYHCIENCCLVFGNEETGIRPEVLKKADIVVKIPQYGVKESLNVASAAAIAIYELRRQNPK
jgi:tRNA G18 (ribose-2'-O)-methylase SpoU